MTDTQSPLESFFPPRAKNAAEKGEPVPWKILIADDEKEVHAVSRLVLKNIVFDHRPVSLMSAFSGEDTRRLIQRHPDIAVIILDVVMEQDDTGLDVIRYIRETLGNTWTRIILRTGQPGQAPAKHVIMAYDINDYREKTELTSQKLVTSVTTALRSYRDLRMLDRNRSNLKYIIDTSADIFRIHSMQEFAVNALNQFLRILTPDDTDTSLSCSGMAILSDATPPVVISGTRKYMNRTGQALTDRDHLDWLINQGNSDASIRDRDIFSRKFHTSDGSVITFYLSGCRNLEFIEEKLLQIVMTNIGVAFDNLCLNREIRDVQDEITHTMVQSIESRYWETGQHVRRIAKLAYLMGTKLGLGDDEIHLLERTAPMHDAGKIGIPDTILMKKGKLSSREYEIVKTHTEIGYKILNRSNQKALRTAALIALQHHEKWLGGGYPQNLSGNEIHLFSRITQIVDVFDTLSTKRIYKPAWSTEKVLNYLDENRNREFEARLVDILIDGIDEFSQIIISMPDMPVLEPSLP